MSIRRPLLVLVVNLLIALAGMAAILAVEVRELPSVDRPVVSVRAQYPGASPETMDAEVTSIVEGAVARVSGISSIQSSSEENNARIRVRFAAGADLDRAASDVREAVSRVQRELPDAVEALTVYKAEEDARPVLRIAAVSDTLSADALTRVLETDVAPQLIAVEGVAEVPLFGDRQRTLRVVVDPLRLTSYGLSITDLAEVLRKAAFDVPAGSFRSEDQELLVRADASVVTAEAVEDIIVRGSTRIGDVANVYFGPQDAASYVRLNGRPTIGLGVVRQAYSNTIEISNGVSRAVERLNKRFDDLELIIIADDATFIRGAVREVLVTLALTIVIVVATIWLFMGSLRTTIIPCVAIPVALVGAVAAIWLFGFSINILTLLALVLVTGLVVDDAIVVLENIERRRGQGLGARAGAVIGTQQMFFAVVTTSVVLIAAFVPIAFLPGTAGRLFREFGVVLAVAMAISSFVALSLVPAMAARVPMGSVAPGQIRRALSRGGNGLARVYLGILQRALAHPLATLAVGLAVAVGSGLLYHTLAQELLPPEDRGVVYVRATGPDGVGLAYSERQASRIEDILRPLVASGEADSLFTVVGFYDRNRILVAAPLAPWAQRERSQQEIVTAIEQPLSQIPGAQVYVSNANSLSLSDAGDGLEIALVGSDYDEIFAAAKTLARAIDERLAKLSESRLSYRPTQPQLSVEIDRRRASDLGIPLDELATTLRAMIGGDELVDLNVADRAIPILLEASTQEINDPSDLVNLHVRAGNGALLPLSSIVTLREAGVAAELDRHAQRRAVEIDTSVAAGYPLQSAVEDVQGLADEVLPPSVSTIFLGEAATLEETSREVGLIYAIALLVVFLVLCAQFESLTSALVVMFIVPFGVAAAILALFLTGTSVNIYSQVGLVMLIGLMAKNGILLVEFADQLRDRGYAVREAIVGSARVRVRPIVMTLMSTVIGGLPLVLSSGAGAEARNAIGWVVFGGLGLAALFTLFLTPVVYLAVAPFSRPRAAEAERLRGELQDAERADDH